MFLLNVALVVHWYKQVNKIAHYNLSYIQR